MSRKQPTIIIIDNIGNNYQKKDRYVRLRNVCSSRIIPT